MFGFVIGLVGMIVGLILRLSFAFGLFVLKVAFGLVVGLLKVLALVCQGIGCLAAKGYKTCVKRGSHQSIEEQKTVVV